MYYHTPELGPEFIRRLYGEMDVTLTQEIRQATDWLGNGEVRDLVFSARIFCGQRTKGCRSMNFARRQWKEVGRFPPVTRVHSVADPAPHRNAARLFVNWLLSREVNTLQRAANTPFIPRSRCAPMCPRTWSQ